MIDNKCYYFNHVPKDVIHNIVEYLDVKSYLNICSTCKLFLKTRPFYLSHHQQIICNFIQAYLPTIQNTLGDLGLVEQIKATIYQLNLDERDITDSSMQCVSHFVNLQWLSLSNCQKITSSGIVYVQQLTQLKVLVLDDTAIDNQALQTVKKLSNLEQLSLVRCDITDTAVESIASLQRLCVLSLKATNITDETLRTLSSVTTLQELNLENCSISPGALQPIQKYTQLRKLFFSSVQFNSTSMHALSGCSQIEKLHMEECVISDVDMRYLEHLPLRILVLDQTQITDVALEIIGRCTHLEELSLTQCYWITDHGIAALQNLQKLRELNIDHTPITNKGLLSLISLREVSISWEHSLITQEGFLQFLQDRSKHFS